VTKTPQHLAFLFSLGIRSERQKLATELEKTILIPTSHKPEQKKQLMFHKLINMSLQSFNCFLKYLMSGVDTLETALCDHFWPVNK